MLKKPIVIGILNATPDSFFDGGRYSNKKTLLIQIEKMLTEGAKIIDVGGFSSRPNCEIISEKEELKRVVTLIENIKKAFPDATLSIDTFRSKVAQECIEAGVSIINDISGGNMDEKMWDVIADYKHVQYILMHGVDNMETMHKNINENIDIIADVKLFFEKKLSLLQKRNIDKQRIIFDPGFGFGKSTQQNYLLLRHLNTFTQIGNVLAGMSRKRMIWKVLDTTPQESLPGTIALNMIALLNGTTYLRVHDVKEAAETIKLFLAYQATNNNS